MDVEHFDHYYVRKRKKSSKNNRFLTIYFYDLSNKSTGGIILYFQKHHLVYLAWGNSETLVGLDAIMPSTLVKITKLHDQQLGCALVSY